MSSSPVQLTVSEFVAVLNQTLEYAYSSVTIVGELSNFRISKNKWVYFDLKDEQSSVKFFGTVFQLPGPLEDGMMLQVQGMPRLHNQFGFSVNVSSMLPVGEGSLRKAAELLRAKLEAEGLFDAERKRPIPYPPQTIGLITSGESAAYHDFIKIINQRWAGVQIRLADVQVQGEAAVGQIVAALEQFNAKAETPDVLVLTRGGGSADDLAVFSTEQVTRAVAASRIPTVVAIGHEVDVSLVELAADQRASTPSNAAELLVPDKKAVAAQLVTVRSRLLDMVEQRLRDEQGQLGQQRALLRQHMRHHLEVCGQLLVRSQQLLRALDPNAALARGYAVVRSSGKIIKSVKQLHAGDKLTIQLTDGQIDATVER